MALPNHIKNLALKLQTFARASIGIINFNTAIAIRWNPNYSGLRQLRLRNGLKIYCRGGALDWGVVNELCLIKVYTNALRYLSKLSGAPLVLDLGANIGVFSLLAAKSHPRALIHAYEPAPENVEMILLHCKEHPELGERIQCHNQAVGGLPGEAYFHYVKENPQASFILDTPMPNMPSVKIDLLPFSKMIESYGKTIDLLKMDIESAEYDILAQSPPEVWDSIEAIALELHPDPSGKHDPEAFLARMKELGFTKITSESRTNLCYFLSRG